MRGDTVVVAIDGPAGAGKSTISRLLADRLGVARLDTGAMYRAVAWAALERGVDPADAITVAALARGIELEVGEKVTVDGADATDAIRTAAVDRAVSAVAANPAVRTELVRRQRAWVAREGSAVVEGRDIGTVVLPDADLKVFLTASTAVRAARRAKERGAVDAAGIEADLRRRDTLDSTRDDSPLPGEDMVGPGTLVVDSTQRDPSSVVDEILQRLGTVAQDGGMTDPEPPAGASVATPSHRSIRVGMPDAVYRAVRWLVHAICRVYWRVETEGRSNVPATGPVILAPVHRSFMDFFVVSEVTRRKIFYMAKDEMWGTPLLGKVLETLGAIPVHRQGADRLALDRAQAVLERGDVLILFPEGTRRTGDEVVDLHEGAAFLGARTGAPIVPIGIGGTADAMPKGSKFVRPVKVHLVVGAPLPPPARSARGRVPRSVVHETTERLRVALQELFDEARRRSLRS